MLLTWNHKHPGTWTVGQTVCLVRRDARAHVWYIKYLRKTETMSGTDVLRQTEEFARTRLGARTLVLQDTSFKVCGRYDYSIAFRAMLGNRPTWYEARGYAPGNAQSAAIVERAKRIWIPRFGRVRVLNFRRQLQRQLEATAGRGRTAWHRRKILAILDSSNPSSTRAESTLKEWLLGLPCDEYAYVMWAAFGDRLGQPNTDSPAVRSVAGIATPGFEEFRQANRINTSAGRILWAKTLTLTRQTP